MIKGFIKCASGLISCLASGVTYRKGVYVGLGVHFVNGKNIVLGKDVQIRPYCDLFAGNRFVIGNRCDIGTRNRIVGNIVIEDSVLFGPDNYICSHDHEYRDVERPIIDQSTFPVCRNGHSELRIGEGSWIGTHCSIIGDVHIGKHCVIGANSVVTTDIPDYSVAVGNPAKVIKSYNANNGKWERVL